MRSDVYIIVFILFSIIFGSDFSNNGTNINIENGVTVTYNGSLENNGLIANNGIIQFNNDFINNDSIQFNNGSMTIIAGDSLLFSGCTFWDLIIEGTGVKSLQNNTTVQGDFILNSSTLSLNGNTIEVFGEIQFNGGTIIGEGNILQNGVDVYSCTDTLALNYSEFGIFDDGSCDLPPLISVNQSALNFGSVQFYEEQLLERIIINEGYYPLEISASVSHPNISLVESLLTVAPNDTGEILIMVDAFVEEMDIYTNIELITNDPFHPNLTIPIIGIIEPLNRSVITEIEDIPNDQGGWVKIHFTRSFHDTDSLRNTEQYTVEVNDGEGWAFLASTTAYNEPIYQAIVHTVIDSSSESNGLLDYRIIAGMEEGNFVSEVIQGYSVDNIVPAEPAEMTLQYGLYDNQFFMDWQANQDDDLSHYVITQNGEVIAEPNISEFNTEINLEMGVHQFSLKAVDVNGNESNAVEREVYILESELSYGNNLISIPGNLENDNSVNFLESIMENGPNVNFLLGQGVGIFNTEDGLSGNLNNISPSAGYWLNIANSHNLRISPEYGSIQNCKEYTTGYGNNLLSFRWGDGNKPTLDALGGAEFASDNFNFILGQGLGLFNTADGWSGNLNELIEGKGYWVNISNSNLDFKWGFDNCENPPENQNFSKEEVEIPEEFHFTQSTEQAFYLVKEIENIENDDLIIAYCGEQLVGSAIWDGGYTAVPVMGRDISEQTMGFCETGEKPQFFLNKDSSTGSGEVGRMELAVPFPSKGEIPEFANLGVYIIEKLESVENEIFPTIWSLAPAYPNPFNPITTIKIGVPEILETRRVVSLNIYDINGRLINFLINGPLKPGFHIIEWDATGHPSGVYFVKLVAGDFIQTQKVVLMK